MNEKDISLVKNISELAKLGVDKDNAPSLAEDMKKMISFAALSNESGSFAISEADKRIALREDTVGETLERKILLSQSAGSNEEYFTVPRVIGGDGNE